MPSFAGESGADAEPWYRRMLGPTSLSWQAIIFAGVLNFPQMVLTGGNLGARTVRPDEYPTIAVISALTILVSFVYGYLGHLTVFRNRHIKPVPLATFLIFYALGGLLYSLGIQVSDAVSGSPSVVPFPLRAVDAMLVSIAWGIGVSLILDGRSRFRIDRDALVGDLLAERERRQQQDAAIDRAPESLISAIDASLTHHLHEIEVASTRVKESADSERGLLELAQAIDAAADVGARQSSHKAWEQSVSTTVKPRFGRTLRGAITSPRLWPAPMAVLVALGVPTVAVRNFGLWWGLPATVVLGLAAWLWMRAAKSWGRSSWAQFALAFVGTSALVSAFAILPAPITAQASAEIGSILIGLIGGFALISFLATLQRERRELLDSLASSVLLEEAQQLAEARAVAQVARRLHGPVQTKLRICAAEIERAADCGDMSGVDEAVQVAMRALIEATHENYSSQVPLLESLRDIALTWVGFVDVQIDIDDQSGALVGREDIVDLVNEAVSNAHHHGHATSAHVRISCESGGIHVTVQDNGSATTMGDPGLGTRLFRSSASHYELSISPKGALLEIVVPETSPQREDKPAR